MKKTFGKAGMVFFLLVAALATANAGGTGDRGATGEQRVVRISKQYGVNYLPLIVLEGRKL